MNQQFQQLKTRELNDRFRTHPLGLGGKVMATQGIMALGNDFLSAAYTAVQNFTDFNADNDPWGKSARCRRLGCAGRMKLRAYAPGPGCWVDI